MTSSMPRRAAPLLARLVAPVAAATALSAGVTLADPAPHSRTSAAPAEQMIEWIADRDGSPRTWRSGGLVITLTARQGAEGSAAEVRVESPDGRNLRRLGQENPQYASASFGVGRIDQRVTGPQVLFASFSGGAHCCTRMELFERVAGRWRVVDLGQWDGGPLSAFPADVDGDGVRDLVLSDERFDYAFASHAESMPPPRIYNVVGGAFVDVSAAPRYRRVFEQALRETETQCRQHNNGACAAFVANAARLGRAQWAWQVMLRSYDRSSDWSYPTHCLATRGPENACPAGRAITFRGMPEALSWFLRDTGYTRRLIAPIR